MNWLAHIFLSEPHIEFRLGNLLADIVRGEERAALSAQFQLGATQHHAIDAFTDSHPIVRRSRQRVRKEFRRFSGVFVDIFYDHMLAADWQRHSNTALGEFTRTFYDEAQSSALVLPERAAAALEHIVRHDLLSSYVDVDGVRQALRGVSARLQRRWGRDFALEEGVGDLVAHHEAFAEDFAQFFPELRQHVGTIR